MKKLVYGGGINDLPGAHALVRTRWQGILRRTDQRDPNWKSSDLYKDCTLHPDWLYLSNFDKWIRSWDNYENKCVDKDIKYPGNRMYGPDTCIMVSVSVNNFFVDPHKRGPNTNNLPQGVYLTSCPSKRNSGKTYRAGTRFDRKRIWCGSHDTIESAYQAHRKIKYEQLQILIEREDCPTVKQILSEIYETKDTASLSRW